MDRKDYNKCQSSNELFAFALQNAIIKALKSDIRVKDLEKGNYIYHSSLNLTISDGAPACKVFRAALEIIRYGIEHNDNPNILLHYFNIELILAISDVGQSVHMAEKKRFGGTITDSHPKS